MNMQRQQQLLDHMKAVGPVTAVQLADGLKLAEATAKRLLNELGAQGMAFVAGYGPRPMRGQRPAMWMAGPGENVPSANEMRRQEVIDYMKEHEPVTAAQVAAALCQPAPSAVRNINELREMKLVFVSGYDEKPRRGARPALFMLGNEPDAEYPAQGKIVRRQRRLADAERRSSERPEQPEKKRDAYGDSALNFGGIRGLYWKSPC